MCVSHMVIFVSIRSIPFFCLHVNVQLVAKLLMTEPQHCGNYTDHILVSVVLETKITGKENRSY